MLDELMLALAMNRGVGTGADGLGQRLLLNSSGH
jgi:hypothetical protein